MPKHPSSGQYAIIGLGVVEQRSRTRVLGCYIEQFRTPAKLLEVADLAAAARKPIVAVKVGRSEGARGALQAHSCPQRASSPSTGASSRLRSVSS